MNKIVPITVESIQTACLEFDIPFIDGLMISLNMHGAFCHAPVPRSRMVLRFDGSPDHWKVILPLENKQSSFLIEEDTIILEGNPVATIVERENDDVVLTYLRAGGRSITLNTNSRSNCIGCVFCPNIIEDAADGTIVDKDGLSQVLEWLCYENNWSDLSHSDVITVCSGCFRTPGAATRHMAHLRQAAEQLGFNGRLHLLSSVIREDDDLKAFVDAAGASHITFTIECFERRDVLLKNTKASLTIDQTCQAIDTLNECGAIGDYTYVAGLDSFDAASEGLAQLNAHVTTFPRIQVFQAHNPMMKKYIHPEASTLPYYLRLRKMLEPQLAERGLKPVYWENYRPLWSTSYNEELTVGPRV
ncbi:hypothetical protein WNZ14_09255 [Hoeflea sp. AS60]|uniref:hypothetical protein n=1 Tax=Hoeflea sp. AS60 TaxID=3135780 RepID=UPI003175257E